MVDVSLVPFISIHTAMGGMQIMRASPHCSPRRSVSQGTIDRRETQDHDEGNPTTGKPDLTSKAGLVKSRFQGIPSTLLTGAFLHISPTFLMGDTAKRTGQCLYSPTACSVGPFPAALPAQPVPRAGSPSPLPHAPGLASAFLTSHRSNEDPRATGSLPNIK